VVERLRAPGSSNVLFPPGLCEKPGVPRNWIWLGLGLTLLDIWHNEWKWVAPKHSLELRHYPPGRPYAQGLLERHGWVGFALLAALLFALLPVTAQVVDYGAEGWLWALFGLSQRRYVDNKSVIPLSGPSKSQPLKPGAATWA
jgi:hypothetical protein